MANGNFPRNGPWLLSPARGGVVSGRPSSNYVGTSMTRQSLYGARAARRGGDWGILGIATAALWFDELTLAAAADEELDVLAPAIIDIWG